MKVTAKVQVKTNSKKQKEKKPTLFTKKYADEIFKYITRTIQKRITSGKDLSGKAFKPYQTPSKAGEKVDLHETGKMLSSADYDFSVGKPIVIFYDVPYAKHVNEDRSFIGLTKQEEKGLEEIIDKALTDYLDALVGR